MHEFNYVIQKIRDQDLPSIQTLCNNPKYLLSDNVSFSEYNSSSISDRWKIYTSDKICNDDEDCTPLIAHESLIRDILYPFKLVKLTIPLSILYLIIWISIFFKYLYATLNRKKALTNDPCEPKIGMVVVIYVLNKNIKCLGSFHAFYPCSNAQTLLPSQLMSFLTDF